MNTTAALFAALTGAFPVASYLVSRWHVRRELARMAARYRTPGEGPCPTCGRGAPPRRRSHLPMGVIQGGAADLVPRALKLVPDGRRRATPPTGDL